MICDIINSWIKEREVNIVKKIISIILSMSLVFISANVTPVFTKADTAKDIGETLKVEEEAKYKNSYNYSSSCGEMAINDISISGVKVMKPDTTTAKSGGDNYGDDIFTTTAGEISTTNKPDTTEKPKVTTKANTKIKTGKTKIKSVVIKKKIAKVSLKKVKGAAGYQIKYSTSRKFTKKTTKTVNVKKTSVTIKKMKKGKKYFFKARALKKVKGKKYYGSWTKVTKAKIRK